MDQPGNNHLLLRASEPAPAVHNGQQVADRMRELLARAVGDHLAEERSVAGALQEIRLRLEALSSQGGTDASGLTAALDGLAATLGTLDSKLTARLERLDERLDDQYDRVRSVDARLEAQAARTEELITRAVRAGSAEIAERLASLEEAVLTLAEALLRPARALPPDRRGGGDGPARQG